MAMMDLDKETLATLGITSESITKVAGKMPMMNVQASMYILIETTNTQEVKQQLDEYAKNYEEQWSTYLPAQYELVQNRKTGVNGNLVYLIISEYAEELEKLVK